MRRWPHAQIGLVGLLLTVGCTSPVSTPSIAVTPPPTLTRAPAATPTAQPTRLTPSATPPPESPTRVPTPKPGVMATMTAAEVLPDQILWQGAIVPAVFARLSAHLARSAPVLQVEEWEGLYTVRTRPMILAATLYEQSPGGPQYARLLFYEPAGQVGPEGLPAFVYKMDLPLVWIGGHEDYGRYDEIRTNLATQFIQPILPNTLDYFVTDQAICDTPTDRELTLCARLAAEGVSLPADAAAARDVILDPWRAASAASPADPADMLAFIEGLADWRRSWWDDPRVVLVDSERRVLCPSAGRGECYPIRVADLNVDAFRFTQALPVLAVTPERAPYYAGVEAQAALESFLNSLAQGDYAAAADRYVGSYGPVLYGQDDLDPNDHASLLRAACAQIETFACLPVGSVLSASAETEYWSISVELRQPDGRPFTYQGCCGPDGTHLTALTSFSFQVVWAKDRFWVANLPSFALPVALREPEALVTEPGSEVLIRQPVRAEDVPEAQQALEDYLIALKRGNYARAAEIYAGPYAVLRDNNPNVAPADYPGLLRNACEINGHMCLTLRSLVRTDVVIDEVRFLVEYAWPDGTLFVRGPCCGASPEDRPPVSQWWLRVIKTPDGYRVLDLPPYVP